MLKRKDQHYLQHGGVIPPATLVFVEQRPDSVGIKVARLRRSRLPAKIRRNVTA